MRIENISDTARWVAAFRADESARPDALFRDTFAEALAGERGRALAKSMRAGPAMTWTMAVRTAVIDELIYNAIRRDGVELVLNLACGLDTRPYRLDLPKTLRWVEADLPGILDFKEQVLGSAQPRCVLSRERVDLANDEVRRAFLERATRDVRKALVLTEGLLMYLPEAAVRGLADDLYRTPAIRWWAFDLVGGTMLRMLQLLWNDKLAEGDARMQFGPMEGPAFFRPHGWREAEVRSYADEGARLHRGLGPRLWRYTRGLTPGFAAKMIRGNAGIVRLERA
jgi:methyltransferase (TIGR00027 family)